MTPTGRKGWAKPKKILTCKKCGCEFHARDNKQAELGREKFCGRKCHMSFQNNERPAPERFWEKIDIKSEIECWEWKAALTPDGYGIFALDKNNRSLGSHRYSYMLHNNCDIPKNLVIRHTCDNPKCCNPYHLLIGTQAQNVADREERNRRIYTVGSQHPVSKLTEEIVLEIKKFYTGKKGEQTHFGKKYNVTAATIKHIVDGRTWKHVQLTKESNG